MIAFIGYGEVAQCFARDLAQPGMTAYDPAFGTPESKAARGLAAGRVRGCASAAEAVAGAEIVFVAVTAGSAQAAAGSLGPLPGAPLVIDVNSVSPATKQADAAAVQALGGRYVEAAVMTSVPPHGIRSPMLLGGPHAAAFQAWGAPYGMKLTAFSGQVGPASSVKMCRSVMIKGMEALVLESMLSARHYGVEADVLKSLGDTLPHQDWPNLARYMISRALLHGRRRAEEVREVAVTVQDAGIEPLMSRAIAERQDWAADRGVDMGRDAMAEQDLAKLLDTLAASGRS